jgi:hypothetical protein
MIGKAIIQFLSPNEEFVARAEFLNINTEIISLKST